jgi:putative redox protein
MSEVKIQISQISACTSETILGPHRVLIDRPVEKGGTAQGPMGGELFLASVGGCFISNILAAIRARNENVANVRVQVTGTLTDSPPVRYSAIELFVDADTPDRAALQHVVEIADRGCIMMNTLRGTLDLRVRVAADSATKALASA